jgi:hypothetical protein
MVAEPPGAWFELTRNFWVRWRLHMLEAPGGVEVADPPGAWFELTRRFWVRWRLHLVAAPGGCREQFT